MSLPKDDRSLKLAAIAADAVLATHVLVAAFAVGGAFLVLISPLYAIAHIPVVLWVGLVNLARWTCPLTPLEKWLRAAAGQESYDTTWTRKYCEPIIRPFGLPRHLELIAGVSILLWNGLLYAWLLLRYEPLKLVTNGHWFV